MFKKKTFFIHKKLVLFRILLFFSLCLGSSLVFFSLIFSDSSSASPLDFFLCFVCLLFCQHRCFWIFSFLFLLSFQLFLFWFLWKKKECLRYIWEVQENIFLTNPSFFTSSFFVWALLLLFFHVLFLQSHVAAPLFDLFYRLFYCFWSTSFFSKKEDLFFSFLFHLLFFWFFFFWPLSWFLFQKTIIFVSKFSTSFRSLPFLIPPLSPLFLFKLFFFFIYLSILEFSVWNKNVFSKKTEILFGKEKHERNRKKTRRHVKTIGFSVQKVENTVLEMWKCTKEVKKKEKRKITRRNEKKHKKKHTEKKVKKWKKRKKRKNQRRSTRRQKEVLKMEAKSLLTDNWENAKKQRN